MALQVENNKPNKRILVACLDAGLAQLIRASLLGELPEFRIDVVINGIEEARQKLNKNDYGWLITSEWLSTKEITASNEANGANLAKEWLSRNRHHRAIVLTETCWESLPWSFTERLSGIPISQVYPCHPLVDLIHAGQAGYTGVPPTVVELLFYKDNNNKTDVLLELRGVCDGPFKYMVEGILLSGNDRKPSQVVGDFKSIAKTFRTAAGSSDPARRVRTLIKGSKDLYDALVNKQPPGLLHLLLSAIDRAFMPFPWRRTLSGLQSAEGPSPIHIHLICEPEMLAIPLDLMFRHQNGRAHLCAELPVTWRVKTNRSANYVLEGERKWNLVDYTAFNISYSCRQAVQLSGKYFFPALKNARKEAKQILDLLGLPKEQAKLTKSIDALRTFFVSGKMSSRHGVNVASHGVHTYPSHSSGVIVGPSPGPDHNATLATAMSLRPNDGEFGPRFAYFNCCELAIQNTGRRAGFSYFGGFAEGAIIEGICAEAISNQWSVSDKWALLLATEFYKMKARTAQGRAVALQRARLKVLQQLGRELAEDQMNPTWLAPIHIWATS